MQTFAPKQNPGARFTGSTRTRGAPGDRHAGQRGPGLIDGGPAALPCHGVPFDFGRIAVRAAPTVLLQTRLAVDTPGDACEQEAESVAARVMGMPDPQPLPGSDDPTPREAVQPLRLRRVAAGAAGQRPVPAAVPPVLRSPGQPLDAATRAFMEPRFGRSFADIRVHSDPVAAASADAIGARAYAAGRNIVFGPSAYQPASGAGRRLIAHELVHTMQQQGAWGAPIQRQPAARPAAAPLRVTVRLALDDQVLNPTGSSPKVTLPNELKEMLRTQVAAAFASLNDESVSVSIEWGKFSNRELSTAGNIEVDLIPGQQGIASETAHKVGQRYLLSPPQLDQFAGEAQKGLGEHYARSDIPRDMLMGANIVLVPRIFRDRVMQWSKRHATANDKVPAELTIAYVAKAVKHEVGHAFGLTDVFNEVGEPGTVDASHPDDKYPSGRANVMDILPLPNEKPSLEEMDWDEFFGPEAELGTRRQRAIDAIRGPVILAKPYADKFLHDRAQVQTFNQFSRTRVEVLEDGRAVWFPAYDKMEFTRAQLDEMRAFLHAIQP